MWVVTNDRGDRWVVTNRKYVLVQKQGIKKCKIKFCYSLEGVRRTLVPWNVGNTLHYKIVLAFTDFLFCIKKQESLLQESSVQQNEVL